MTPADDYAAPSVLTPWGQSDLYEDFSAGSDPGSIRTGSIPVRGGTSPVEVSLHFDRPRDDRAGIPSWLRLCVSRGGGFLGRAPGRARHCRRVEGRVDMPRPAGARDGSRDQADRP